MGVAHGRCLVLVGAGFVQACRGLGLSPTRVLEDPMLSEVSPIPPLEALGHPQAGGMVGLVLGLLLALTLVLFGRWAGRLRPNLEAGLFSRVLGGLSRMAVLGAVLVLLWELWMAFMPPISSLSWSLMGAALLVLAAPSGLYLCLDVGACLLLRLEGRVRPGIRISNDEVSGAVARLGYRAVRVLASKGPIEVPGRFLMGRTLQIGNSHFRKGRGVFREPIQRRGAEHEVCLQLDPEKGATALRQELEDAALASAWISTQPDLRVGPEPLYPGRWTVRCRLLDARFAPRFDASLIELIDAARWSPEPMVTSEVTADISTDL